MFGFHRHSPVSDTMCVQLIHHQLIPFLCNLSSHIISNMPSSNASQHPGCCLCGSSRSPRHFSLLIHFASTPAWLWLTMVLVKSTSCCELIDQTTLHVSVRWHSHTMCDSHKAPTQQGHSPTAQGCSGFAHSEEWEHSYSIKVTLHIYSFLLNLLFIQHLVSRVTDEGPFTLSRALHTSSYAHRRTHTFEGDGGWCMTMKMQRDRQGFWL